MSDKTNARNQDRTPYRGPVWIQPADGASLVGDVRNVSQGGMFVNVIPTPPVGQEIVCELPGYRAVRGRVVWISSPAELADHGVGIEFVDLSERPTPLLAMPTTTYAGIEFAGPLDFLSEGAEVHLAAPNGHRQLRARVADVELDHAHGATHLALSLVIAPTIEDHVHHGDEEDWFPEITFDAAKPVVATPIVERLVAGRNSQLDDTLALRPGTADDTERSFVATPAPVRSGVLVPLAAVSVLVLAGLAIARFPAVEQPAPMPIAPIKVATVEAPAPAPTPTPMIAEPMIVPPAAPKPAADPSMWKPQITTSKGEPSVLVPLAGSTKGMTSFVLDQPQGIAVDLPNAQLAITAKSYLLRDAGFTSLWVRKMDKGVQIRLHVVKGVHLEALVEDGALRIRKK